MRGLRTMFFMALVVMTGSCADDPVEPDGQPDFAFEATVKDTNGAPVSGLQATLFVPLDPPDGRPEQPSDTASPDKANVLLRFETPVEARLHIQFLDLLRRPVKDLLDEVLPAGAHLLAYDGTDEADEHLLGTVVLLCRLRAFDPVSHATLFADSTLAVLCTGVDRQQRPSLGTTDAAGVIRSVDPLLFPGIFQLPPLNGVDESGNGTGSFSISDSVQVLLRNPENGMEQTAVLAVGPGINRFDVIWDPARAATTTRGNVASLPRAWIEPVCPKEAASPPLWSWMLYPNPFN